MRLIMEEVTMTTTTIITMTTTIIIRLRLNWLHVPIMLQFIMLLV